MQRANLIPTFFAISGQRLRSRYQAIILAYDAVQFRDIIHMHEAMKIGTFFEHSLYIV